jgi:DNA (cytosine-5)-methyltransferase 1
MEKNVIEGAGLLSARKKFSPQTKPWRERLIQDVLRGNGQAPRLDGMKSRIRDTLDEVVRTLFVVSRIFEVVHGTPDFGNLPDPLNELIFISISQRTKIKTAKQVFDALKARFPNWEEVLVAPDEDLAEIVSVGGRGNLRVKAIREILQAIREQTGTLSLEFLRELPQEKALNFLTTLPWVGEKTARCVLMYSLRHGTFPADVHSIRIFTRTGLLDPLVGTLEGLEHRKAQQVIAPLIPPDIAYALHVNMVAHGQEVCRERNPRCHQCEISKFCKQYRIAQVERVGQRKRTLVDLFCGAGGLSLGFVEEGFKVLLAVDNDPAAIRTYRLNHTIVPVTSVLEQDITLLPDEEIRRLVTERVDVLVAGVPCQGFSRVGYRTKPDLMQKKNYSPEDDAKNRLFLEMIRVADILQPRIILLENVPDMGKASVKEGERVAGVIHLLEKRLPDYVSTTISLDTSRYGVPQRRKRLFFLAFRRAPLSEVKEILERIRDEIWSDTRLPLSLAEGIDDLPPLAQGEGEQIAVMLEGAECNGNFYTNFVRGQGKVLYNHQARPHNKDDMKIIRALEEGENYVSLLRRRPDVIEGRTHKVYSRENFPDKFYRMRAGEPARTIPAHLARDGNSFILPSQDRSLTVREAARLQSFPNDWIFTGSRFSQFTQVGNAVPPLLALIIARFFKELLEEEDGRTEER